jgi:DHA2 family multidrug resistance protein
MLQHGFESKGMTPDVALKTAYQALDFSITKQAMVLSYMDVFLYIGILFLICVPFILLIREKKNKKVDLSSAMH